MFKDWLNLWPWAPGGFANRKDERAMQLALRNLYRPVMRYREEVAAHILLDRGDEHFNPNAYAYIPVIVAGRGQFQQNMHATVDAHIPYQQRPPSMAQLAQWSYGAANDLWEQIRQNTRTEWEEN